MKLLKLYSLIIGTMGDFIKPFSDNKALYDQARKFWMELDNYAIVTVLIFLFLGIAMAAYYYTSYNNKPGRHYTPKHWGYWLVATLALAFLLTLGFEYIAVTPKIQGALWLEVKIAFAVCLWAGVTYFIISFVWCNFGLSTNAYRLLKLTKQ